MFRRYKRRHTNILFVIFRLLLSLVIFATLIAGLYYAYKHFSGLDPLRLDPKNAFSSAVGLLSKINLPKDVQNTINQNLPGTKVAVHKDTPSVSGVNIQKPSKEVFKFVLLSDSHSDNVYLKKALNQIKKDYSDIRFIIGLGDYTDVGTLDELKKVKNELDSIGFRYFVTPGDHDLWDSRNKSLSPLTNFNQVFGPPFQSFIHENYLFLLLFNSDNYQGLGNDQKNWLTNQLDSNPNVAGIFIFLHEPFFHPSSDHVMGRVEPKLKEEAENLTKQLASAGVKKVFAGDTHFFSEYQEPQTNLFMVTVGVITSVRNLQPPRFAIVSVFENGSTRVEDVEVN
ncbi:MAG: metallophosphoesterase [Patescibacteria group bacterium]